MPEPIIMAEAMARTDLCAERGVQVHRLLSALGIREQDYPTTADAVNAAEARAQAYAYGEASEWPAPGQPCRITSTAHASRGQRGIIRAVTADTLRPYLVETDRGAWLHLHTDAIERLT